MAFWGLTKRSQFRGKAIVFQRVRRNRETQFRGPEWEGGMVIGGLTERSQFWPGGMAVPHLTERSQFR